MITTFGSCRVDGINGNNNLNNSISYLHNTKEMIQMIKILNKEIVLEEPYNILCFRTGILNNKHINITDNYVKKFQNSKIVLLEICSIKKYIHNGYYLHHNSVVSATIERKPNPNTPKDIIENFIVMEQNYNELEDDILQIKEMLKDKYLIIVTHYNSKLHGSFLKSRNMLITNLENICKKHNIVCINPTNILKKFNQDDIITNDLGHYTSKGKTEIIKYIDEFIKSNISN